MSVQETSAKILAERKEEASRVKLASYAAAVKSVASPAKAELRPCDLPTEPSVYEPEDSDSAENIVVDLRIPAAPHNSLDDTLGVAEVRVELLGESTKSLVTEMSESNFHSPQTGSECPSPSKAQDSAVVTTSTGERSMDHAATTTAAVDSHAAVITSTGERALEHAVHDPIIRASPPISAEGLGSSAAQLAAQLAQGGFGTSGLPPAPAPETTAAPPKAPAPAVGESRRQSVGEQRRYEIITYLYYIVSSIFILVLYPNLQIGNHGSAQVRRRGRRALLLQPESHLRTLQDGLRGEQGPAAPARRRPGGTL